MITLELIACYSKYARVWGVTQTEALGAAPSREGLSATARRGRESPSCVARANQVRTRPRLKVLRSPSSAQRTTCCKCRFQTRKTSLYAISPDGALVSRPSPHPLPARPLGRNDSIATPCTSAAVRSSSIFSRCSGMSSMSSPLCGTRRNTSSPKTTYRGSRTHASNFSITGAGRSKSRRITRYSVGVSRSRSRTPASSQATTIFSVRSLVHLQRGSLSRSFSDERSSTGTLQFARTDTRSCTAVVLPAVRDSKRRLGSAYILRLPDVSTQGLVFVQWWPYVHPALHAGGPL